jgi:hypothetical protein
MIITKKKGLKKGFVLVNEEQNNLISKSLDSL